MKRPWLVITLIGLALASGIIGAYIGRSSARPATTLSSTEPARAPATQEVWTCSMHPQIRLDRPGTCPICEMPLIPAGSSGPASGDGVPSLQLSEQALAMANVQTTPVSRRQLIKDVRAVGTIEYNESALATITARIDGYAERLFVNFTGVDIRKGDHLVEIYSPDLLVAQQEMLIALSAGHDPGLVETARIKLRLYGLTDAQIDELAMSRRPTERVTLYTPIDGTVIERLVVQHGSFQAGDVLYRIANLDTVWVYLDIYEIDLPWLRYGQRLQLTTEGYPGRVFEGMVTFVQPVVNPQTRTIRVPVHIENADHALKPGMYVSAVIKAALGPDGTAAPTGVEGKYTCPMHPHVLQESDGACPVCDMPLEQIPAAPQSQIAPAPAPLYACPMHCEGDKAYPEPGRCPVCNMKLVEREQSAGTGELLAVPVSAVLDSGTRTIVYVEKSRGLFEPREIVLGPRGGEFYPVLKGLAEGERVVTRGGFLIDSQFQITGHSSLFYPGGLHANMGHEHATQSSSVNAPAAPESSPQPPATDPHLEGGSHDQRHH